MGRQIRFFMDSEDEHDFIKAVVALEGQFISKELNLVDLEQLNQEINIRTLYIRFPSSKINVDCSGLLDIINSDAIEYVRCIENSFTFSYGRLWISTKEGTPKEMWFSSKYNLIIKWIKNTMKISQGKDFYIAAGAEEKYKLGAKMMATPITKVDFN